MNPSKPIQSAQTETPLTISVIMPAFNAAHYLERSLPPLVDLRERGHISEIIVVDDCSTDPSNVETARRLGASLMSTPKNGGPGAARNIAAAKAIGDVIWFVDADVIAHPSGPSKIREAFARANLTAVFGSYDDRPPAQNFASQYKNLVHRYYHQNGADDASTFWAGCGAVRRDAFRAIGGFDTHTYRKPTIEDIDLGRRLIGAGGKIRLVHDLLGTHLKKWTLVEVARTDILQRALPWSRMLLSSGKVVNDLNLSPAEKIRAVVALAWIASVIVLPFAFVAPTVALGAAAMSILVAIANWRFIQYFARTRGAGFALAAVLYHQVYYLYSSAVYAYCVLEHALRRRSPNTLQDQHQQAGPER
jgi:cellulose synthase/poly-beta-1,6-N-acetylglucosamine synthase-like glycosyltransferase